ncbi:hypothetical protein AKUA1805_01120 [Apilactobacillus kunkeei]|nr:hypothetical protein AKUA2101_01120 [Apilactobacillus kunkeei]CAI2555197.1 hypothetical protein AKUA1805_01120 [Apilactobacillus kunkeei]
MITKKQEQKILSEAEEFFYDFFQDRANKYDKKNYKDFKINPFLIRGIAGIIGDDSDPKNIASAIAYPFAMGTSLSTSFGSNIQEFVVKTMGDLARGSTTSGIDIEFTDAIDGRNKYCQLKCGPQTINKDDIKTIVDHFHGVFNLARTNHVTIDPSDCIVGVVYGSHDDLSTMYTNIEKEGFPVLAGEEFWYHLTGSRTIYKELISIAQDASNHSGMKKSVENLRDKIAKHVEENKDYFGIE